MKDTSRATVREKISFGFGAVAYCTEMTFVMTYITLFCTDILMIDIAVIGLVISGVRILDAVTDIIVTSIADRTNTKWGKYRVWVLFGIPLAIMLFLLFSSPAFLQTARAKTVWVSICYILLVSVLETSMSCPYNAMIMTMSKHAHDQFDFTLSRALGEAGAQLLVSITAMPLLMLSGSYKEHSGWRLATAVFAIIIIIASLICFLGTKERVKITNLDSQGTPLTLQQKFSAVAKNSVFWKVIALSIINTAQYYATASLFPYFCINNLGHPEWVSPLLSICTAMQVTITILLFYFGKKHNKRTLLLIGAGCISLGCLLLFICNSFPVAVIYEFLIGTGSGLFTSIVFALIPDLSEYIEWKSYKAIPGMVSAFVTFAIKIGASISMLLTTQILVWVHYDNTAIKQSSQTLHLIRLCLPISVLILIILAFLILISLRELDADKMIIYRCEIDERTNNHNNF